MKFAVAAYCVPVVALGPLLAVLYGGDTPKVVLAAFAVFFATLISMLVGLKSAPTPPRSTSSAPTAAAA